jgi:hypothetical protein
MLGVLSSHSALSVLVGVLLKKFSLLLNKPRIHKLVPVLSQQFLSTSPFLIPYLTSYHILRFFVQSNFSGFSQQHFVQIFRLS